MKMLFLGRHAQSLLGIVFETKIPWKSSWYENVTRKCRKVCSLEVLKIVHISASRNKIRRRINSEKKLTKINQNITFTFTWAFYQRNSYFLSWISECFFFDFENRPEKKARKKLKAYIFTWFVIAHCLLNKFNLSPSSKFVLKIAFAIALKKARNLISVLERSRVWINGWGDVDKCRHSVGIPLNMWWNSVIGFPRGGEEVRGERSALAWMERRKTTKCGLVECFSSRFALMSSCRANFAHSLSY